MSRKIVYIAGAILLGLIMIAFISFSVFKSNAYNSRVSTSNVEKIFEVKKNQGAKEIGQELEVAGLIKNKYYFYYQIKAEDLASKIQAGEYELSPDMTVGEMIQKFVDGDIKLAYEKLVIPEGFTNAKIIERIAEIDKGLAEEFEDIVGCWSADEQKCGYQSIFKDKYSFLSSVPEGVDLEGYLFPDTYFVYPEDDALKLVTKFLNNFEDKVTPEMIQEIESQGKTLHEVLTLASIVEKEVRSDKDKKIVAGIFWNRANDDYPLQSCATLAYILGEDKKQYTIEDTQIESPFNTYLHAGLPPGPVSNPGLKSIEAAISPTDTDYYFFLSDPETGETVFSKTLEEHNINKYNHGL